MKNRLVNTSIQILRSIPVTGLHTNAVISQTSRDRSHVIDAIRFLRSGKLVETDEKNWKFGQKKKVVPTDLGLEIKILMEDLDEYNDAYLKFRETLKHFDDLVETHAIEVMHKDYIEVKNRYGNHKVKDQAEADDLFVQGENATRRKLKHLGWTDEEIELGPDTLFGLDLVNTFCDRNIFSALGQRYAFLFFRFGLDKNEVAENILKEVIVGELKGQLGNLLLDRFKKNPESANGYSSIDKIYNVMYNQITYPILENLMDVLDVEKYKGNAAKKMENTKKICYSLLFNRFVSSEVRRLIMSLLRVLHHYTSRNGTPLIDMLRTSQRANSMSAVRLIDDELRSKAKRLTIDKKLGLQVEREYNSVIERWFRADGEGDSDEKTLWSSISPPETLNKK